MKKELDFEGIGKDMIGKMKMIDWIICLIIPLQICTHMQASVINVNYIYLLFVLIICLHFLKDKNLFIYKNEKGIYAGIVLCFLIIPALAFHIDNVSSILYVGLLILFLVACDVMGQRLAENGEQIIKYWTILAVIVSDYMVLMNINQINVNTITAPLYNSNEDNIRYRATFGFSHPNFAAIVFVTVLLLCYISTRKMKNKKEKRIFAILGSLNIIPLLCTGSRTAIISTIAFIAFEIVFWLFSKVQNPKVRLSLTAAIWLMAIFIGLGINVDFQELSTFSSGRLTVIIRGLESLQQKNSLWFGYIVSNVSEANAALSSSGATTSDNWYYLHIARFGIVGLICFAVPFIGMLKRIYAYIKQNHHMKYVLSASLALLLYGMGENVVYNQGVVICTVIWAFLFSALALERSNDKVEV